MITVKINDKIKEIDSPAPLKALIPDLKFPCGGKGICGKCKIRAQGIAPTPKDFTFFTREQIEQGVRIACDKIIEQDCSVFYSAESVVKDNKKIEHCAMFAYLGSQKAIIGILDEGLEEAVEYTYEKDIKDEDFGKYLKAKLIQLSLELMEAYGVPQAESLLIGGDAFVVAALTGQSVSEGYSVSGRQYSLPAEDVFVLPFINEYLGSDIIAALAGAEEYTLFINFSNIVTFGMKTGEGYLVAPLYTPDDFIIKEVFLASVTYFYSLNPEIKRALVLGKLPFDLPFGLQAVSAEEKIIEFFALAATGRKYRTTADKIRRRCDIIDLSEEALWQDCFSGLTQSGDK
jgi:hypothetical protein